MDKTQFEQEKQYGAAVAIAKQLLHRKLITPMEYQRLTVVLAQKYRPAVNSSPDFSGKLAKKGV